MKSLDIEGKPRDPKEDAKLHPDLAHPNPPRNEVKSCAKKDGCLHLHGHDGRCRTPAECLCDLTGPFCEVHNVRTNGSGPPKPTPIKPADYTLPTELELSALHKEKF